MYYVTLIIALVSLSVGYLSATLDHYNSLRMSSMNFTCIYNEEPDDVITKILKALQEIRYRDGGL